MAEPSSLERSSDLSSSGGNKVVSSAISWCSGRSVGVWVIGSCVASKLVWLELELELSS